MTGPTAIDASKFFLQSTVTAVIFIFIIFTLPFGKTPSAPEHEDDENNKLNTTIAYSWQAPPDTRGTYSIISSCLLTWGLCMWSAIHLNIPRRSWARWQWAGKCMWLIWGMFSPEIICFAGPRTEFACKGIEQVRRKYSGSP